MPGTTVTIVYKVVNQMTAPLQKMQMAAMAFEKRLTSLNYLMAQMRVNTQRFNAVLQGIGLGVGIGSFYALERAIGSAIRVIPDLISKGLDWMRMLDELMDKSGMSAQSATSWAGVIKFVGGDVDRFATSIGRLSKIVIENEEKFADWGIATRDANNNLLPVDRLLDNVRRKLSELGPSAATSAQLLMLLSRSGLEFVDAMVMTDQQIATINERLRGFGLFVGEDAIAAAENLQRMRNEMDLATTGIGTQIALGVTPVLTQLVTAISQAITDNMGNIVNFATKAVYFVAGLIQGFFSLNLNLEATTDKLGGVDTRWDAVAESVRNYQENQQSSTSAMDDATAALERQIRAIDDQIRALDRREQKHDAARTRKDLVEAIRDAKKGEGSTDAVSRAIQRQIDAIDKQIEAIRRRRQAQDDARRREELVGDIATLEAELAELQGKGIFTAGMTALEAELARQQHEADITDQMGRVQDAKDRLNEHDEEVAERLHTEELERQREELRERLRVHEAMINSQKRLADAIDRLREFDHDQEVRKQRERLEDRKRVLQDELAAVKESFKNMPDFDPLKDALSPQKVEEWGSQISEELQEASLIAQREGRELATRIREFLFGKDTIVGAPGENSGFFGGYQKTHEKGLLEKIGDLIKTIDALVTGIGNFITFIDQNVVQPLARFLGFGPGNRGSGQGPGIIESTVGGLVTWGALSKVVPKLPGPLAVGKGVLGTVFGSGAGKGTSLIERALTPTLTRTATSAATRTGLGALAGTGLRTAGRLAAKGLGPLGAALGFLAFPEPTATQASEDRLRARYSPGGEFYGTPQRGSHKTINGREMIYQDGRWVPAETAPSYGAGSGLVTATRGQLPGFGVMDVMGVFKGIEKNTGQGGPLWRGWYDATSVLDSQNSKLDDTVTQTTRSADKLDSGIGIDSPDLSGIRTATKDTADRLGGTLGTRVTNTPDVAVPGGTRITNQPDVTIPGQVRVFTAGGGTVNVEGTSGGIGLGVKGVASIIENTHPLSGMRYATGSKLSTSTATGTKAPGCFVAGSMVATPLGDKAIEQIVPGDFVYAVGDSGKLVEREVTATHHHYGHTEGRVLVTLTDGRKIEATKGHRFYSPLVADYVAIGEGAFLAGDVVRHHDHSGWQNVTIAKMEQLSGAENVFNLTVDVDHNYLVAGILVHNTKTVNAMGAVGLTKGLTDIGWAGDAGDEAVAIIRRPRKLTRDMLGGDSPRELVVHNHIYLDGRKIEENTTRRQIRGGAYSSTYREN